MEQFFLSMFSNSEGTSYKRVLGTAGFISLITFMFSCAPAHKEVAVSSVEYITLATILGTVAEKFAKKSTTIDNTTNEG